VRVLLVDVLGQGEEGRKATIDVIGAGPRAVAGVLERCGVDVDLATYDRISKVKLRRYDALFVSAMTVDFPATRRVLSIWKRIVGRGIAVVGGPLACNPYDALARAGFDLCVIGEAEQTLEELIERNFDAEDVKGVGYVERGDVVVNPLRPIMPRESYDQYTPSVEVIRNYPLFFASRVYVEVVRGCSNYYRTTLPLPDGRQCTGCNKCRTGELEERYYCPVEIPPGCGFCSVPSTFGPPRSRSVKKIVEEVEGLIEEGCKRIVLSGSDILEYGRDLLVEPEPLTDPRSPEPNYETLEELFSTVKSIPQVEKGEVFVGIENVKACLLTEEAAKLLGKYFAGCPVHIGCETGDEEHARAIGRPSMPREVVEAVRRLKRHGLQPYVYFIHGLPGQNKRTARQTVKIMREVARAGAEKITIYRFQSLPMSAFEDMPSGPPAARDPLSMEIVREGERINLSLKEKLMGSTVKAVVAAKYPKIPNSLVAYPIYHGPVIVVRGSSDLIGAIVNVRVTGILSSRAVRGEVLEAVRPSRG